MIKDIKAGLADYGLQNDLVNIREKQLLEQLKKLDEAYKAIKNNRLDDYISSLPKSLSLERLSYDAPSDEELMSQAESKYEGDYEQGQINLISRIEKTRQSLNDSKDKLSQAEQETLSKLDKTYATVIENIGNQALRRGLGRSSIVVNKVTEAELSRAEQAGIIESGTRQSILALDRDIENLEREFADSMKAFDLSHAAKVQTEINKLIAERDKKVQAVVEYNNKIEKDEYNYEASRAQMIDSYKDKLKKEDASDYKYYLEHGYYPGMQDEYEQRYNMAYDFYMSLPKDTAKRVLNENTELEKYLGASYYNKLKTIIVMRK